MKIDSGQRHTINPRESTKQYRNKDVIINNGNQAEFKSPKEDRKKTKKIQDYKEQIGKKNQDVNYV